MQGETAQPPGLALFDAPGGNYIQDTDNGYYWDVIVIGGGVGNIDLLYDRGIDSVKEYIFNHGLETPIVKPSLGDSAGVFGAAFLSQAAN